MSDVAHDGPRAFSLHDGGPFYLAMRWLGLVAPSGRIRGDVLALFAWLPIMIGAGVRAALHMPADPTVHDLSVHVRLVVALPVMMFAERIVEPACASAINSLYVCEICDRESLDAIVANGHRLRDAWWPELLLAAAALIGGQLALWEVTGPTGLVHGGTGAGWWSFPHLWYVILALPLVQFIMLRWLWRWVIWSYMLARLARRPLALLATHPDRAGGLLCVARPVFGFGGFAFAIGAVLSSAWGSQLIAQDVPPRAHLAALLAFLLTVVAIAVGPLLPFSGHVYRARRYALAKYGDLASAYVSLFHTKWIGKPDSADALLGTSDLQSLADLGNSYSVIATTRMFVFSIRSIASLWLAAILPMVPLFVSLLSVEQVLARVVKTVLGGVP